jgi:D-alanyl-lipoteichoic acid acyltransferase DltB (MBOAT superfamily)
MIFNSIEFLIFFVIVFSVYYFFLKEKTKLQNILLLVASYVFYAWANWKILPLLAVTTAGFYGLGIAISESKTDKYKSLFTTLGVIIGIGALLYFKYFNFFILSFKSLFESCGLQTNLHTFNIILPVGISFYTFRLLSYVIDIQRGKCEATRDIVSFATYVAFFPCILSGPIDRPATLIPQLQSKRAFDYSLAVDGMRQILWGLFKKIVVADNCAVYAGYVFGAVAGSYEEPNLKFALQLGSGVTLFVGAIFFTFQLYCDFSGYSDMAIGVAKLLRFRVTKNFDYPFFAQNIAEFWRKWHISLTSWLTDYVFMPLNIKWRDYGKLGMIAAIIINFIFVGLWHGDNEKFVLFGLYHSLLFIPLILSGAMFKKNKIITNKLGLPKLRVLFNILLTFSLVALGNIFFRADTIGQAFTYLGGIIDSSLFSLALLYKKKVAIMNVSLIIGILIVEWIGRKNEFGLEKLGVTWKKPYRWIMYSLIVFLCFMFVITKETPFIYFQF